MQPLLEHTRRHDITFCRNGIIRITARVARVLDISPGDSINIACYGGEYLLFATRHNVGRHEGQCRPTKKGSGNFCANSARLCRSLFESLGLSCEKASFMAGEKITLAGSTFLPIITSAPMAVSLCERSGAKT